MVSLRSSRVQTFLFGTWVLAVAAVTLWPLTLALSRTLTLTPTPTLISDQALRDRVGHPPSFASGSGVDSQPKPHSFEELERDLRARPQGDGRDASDTAAGAAADTSCPRRLVRRWRQEGRFIGAGENGFAFDVPGAVLKVTLMPVEVSLAGDVPEVRAARVLQTLENSTLHVGVLYEAWSCTLEDLELPEVTSEECTHHTVLSAWVREGRPAAREGSTGLAWIGARCLAAGRPFCRPPPS